MPMDVYICKIHIIVGSSLLVSMLRVSSKTSTIERAKWGFHVFLSVISFTSGRNRKTQTFSIMKKLLVLSFLVSLPFLAYADPVEIDGIYYNLNSSTYTAEVTSGRYKYSGRIIIPDSISCNGRTYKVVVIGEGAFATCSELTTITIGNNIVRIGYNAFGSCSGLEVLTLGNSVKTIQSSAFSWCSSLKSITIPNSVATIESSAFGWCI